MLRQSITLSDNGSEAAAEVAWIEPDSRIRDAWANATDATENGAYGCVIAGIELLRHLFAVRRAETRTGSCLSQYLMMETSCGAKLHKALTSCWNRPRLTRCE